MPNPAFRSVSSNNTGTFNSFPIAKPAGVVDGDLLLVCLTTYDSTGTMAHGTPPTGWTLVRALNASGRNIRTSVYRKIAASEPSSWTFTKTNDSSGFGGVICCIAISDPGTPNPIADENGAVDSSGDNNMVAPSVTAGSANDLLVYFSSIRSGAASYTPPTGFTEQMELHQSGQDMHLEAATKTAGAAGATGSVSANCNISTSDGTAFLIAVAAALPPSVPAADFTGTPTTGSATLAVTFTDASTNTPTSWAWDFGDGGTSSSQNPSHSYTSSGVYTVSLTATNAAGSNTKTRTAYITVSETVVYAAGGGIDIY